MNSLLKRRTFLGYLATVLALSRCKIDVIKPSTASNAGQNLPSSPPPVTDEYLAQYGITEMGSDVVPSDPKFNQSINGYTDQISYNPGDTVTVYLSGPPSNNTVIPLLDTRRNTILSISAPITTQKIKSDKPWVDGFMYDKTFSYKLPANFKSGIYTWFGTIPFICKAPGQSADITVVYPSNTTNAYNFAGGKSLYAPDGANRATVLSFLRSQTISYVEFYKWVDKLSYVVNYVADSDLDNYSAIENSKIVIITGHSEYWTRKARLNIDKFIDSGKNVLILSGNNMWWQTRYNESKNQMICYKGTADPLNGTLYGTGSWGNPILNYAVATSIGADFNEGGYGQVLPNRWDGYRIVQENSPVLSGSGLKYGDMLSMRTTEYDSAPVVKMLSPGSQEIPVIDNTKLNYYKTELLGYDFAQNAVRADQLGLGTFIVCKKSQTAGTVVNAASMDWCYNIVYDKFKTITKNMIDLSLSGASLFSPPKT